ncbi:MAG: LysM peptidoglycan-binding domain-containing protein [Chloroflexi bacterium]|nr:LysM peptidoglycan-binding domain-containing protein [Chloroflexota bacterium]
MSLSSTQLSRVLFLIALVALALAFVPALITAAPSEQQPGSGGQYIYIVQPHDTLYSISRRFNTTVPALMTANNLLSEYIYVGQRLIIPTVPVTPPAPPPDFACKYTVAAKDTVFSIAYRYQVKWYQLMQANYLYSPLIFVGQTLNVPCRTPQPAPFPIYTVVAGDNLFRIAVKYETSIYAIALVNGIHNPHLIYVGQNLVVPYTGTVKYPPIPTITPTGTPGTPTPTITPGGPTLTPTPTTTTGAPAVVIMQNIAFLPPLVTIQRGASVRWENRDSVAHTVTSGTPGNLTGFFRANLSPGQVFTYTFGTPGTYPYFCEIHGAQMTASVTVQ